MMLLNLGRFGDMFYKMGDWLAKLIYLHLIWLLFTLLGLIIFGFMPATVAMFSIMRKWIMKEDVPIFKYFLQTYKTCFVEKNILGGIYFLTGLILYLDFIISYTKIQWLPLHVVVWGLCILFALMIAFSFPVYAHLELNKVNYLKQTFLIVLSSPVEALLMFIIFIILFYVFLFIPIFFIFCGSTMIGFPIMWLGLRAFQKIEKKANAALD